MFEDPECDNYRKSHCSGSVLLDCEYKELEDCARWVGRTCGEHKTSENGWSRGAMCVDESLTECNPHTADRCIADDPRKHVLCQTIGFTDTTHCPYGQTCYEDEDGSGCR
ncbi:MAG: hypothetical protein FJ087_03745 [Deltaproteobacteria bacterium]|nr:hypothetical protein [Deltaproteobacteria bacterium]